VHRVEGEGHLVPIEHWAEMLTEPLANGRPRP
jgi:hypothetical protein